MNFTVTAANWQQHKAALSHVRRKVFIEEQQVPEHLEWDEFDESSYHVIALDNNDQPIGCGRLKCDGQIGRMAVMKDWRNQGVGTAILENILQHAAMLGMSTLYLHAQITAIPFYERHGFKAAGDIFMDAGIPHRSMTKLLESQ